MSTVNQDAKTRKAYVFTKGAPERILEKCDRLFFNGRIYRLTTKEKSDLLKKNESFATAALRVLGFAYKEYSARRPLEENLIFVGLQGMIDPPHDEVPSAVQKCKDAGIRVIMVTGDHQLTAEAIAKSVSISGDSMTGAVFESLSEADQIQALYRTSVFARVDPKHKLMIVNLLQKQGETVAMTGDGINDAPALKKADLGIAMGVTGTDVAKEASDMVLQDDNFSTIVNAIEEGRGIYENIQKFINYLFSCNISEVAIILIAVLFGWPLPMTAIMLLWLNLVTDGLPALALSVDPPSGDLMKRPPKKAREQIMNKEMISTTIFTSLIITAIILGLFYWAMQAYEILQGINAYEQYLIKIQTITFVALIFIELVRIQVIRSEYRLSFSSNKYIFLAVVSSIVLTILIIYTPLRTFFGATMLNIKDWSFIISASLLFYVLSKGESFLKRRRFNKDKAG